MTPYYAVVQIGGIRYQRKPYLCMITTVKADADAYAAGITNAIVFPLLNETDFLSLDAILTSYAAGWRPSEIVYDAAFNGVGVMVSGLSAGKRYRAYGTIDQNGGSDWCRVRPDNLVSGTGAYVFGSGVTSYLSLSYFSGAGATEVKRGFCMTLDQRRGGLSMVVSSAQSVDPGETGVGFGTLGVTSTDFTSLYFAFGQDSGVARTGWLTVIEESP